MKTRRLSIELLAVCLAACLPSVAQELTARRASDWDPNANHGQFDLRLRVDGAVDVFIQGDRIRYQIVNGAAPTDVGSEYTAPIPRAQFRSFTLEKKDGRGRIELREEPSPRNNYTAYIHFRDSDGGSDRYHARIRWEAEPGTVRRGDDRDRGRGRPPWRDRDDWRQRPRDDWREPPGRRTDRSPWSRRSLPGARLNSYDNDPSRYDNRDDGILDLTADVDDTVVLRVRGDEVWAETLRGRAPASVRFRFSQPLPSGILNSIEITDTDGRGRIELTERPSQANDYVATIRITDSRGGSDRYSFRLEWRR